LGRGNSIYTVEEVSERLGIPRPTLYRYLRDYGISHARQSGRIAIPEDSFDTIREARDLHREGLGTESVRKRLAEGDAGLAERFDAISATLEELRENLGPPHGMSSHEALRTILARQTLIISAVSDLTGMVEDLLATSGQTRRRPNAHLEKPPEDLPIPEREKTPAATGPPDTAPSDPTPAPPQKRFGASSRRRRRGVLAVVLSLVLLSVGAVAVAAPSLDLLPDGWQPTATNTGAPASEGQGRNPRPNDEDMAAESPAVLDASSGGAAATRQPVRATPERSAAERSAAATDANSASLVVPDVAGWNGLAAMQRLDLAGFRVEDFSTAPGPEGVVLATDPQAGTPADPGTPVDIVVGAGPDGV